MENEAFKVHVGDLNVWLFEQLQIGRSRGSLLNCYFLARTITNMEYCKVSVDVQQNVNKDFISLTMAEDLVKVKPLAC